MIETIKTDNNIEKYIYKGWYDYDREVSVEDIILKHDITDAQKLNILNSIFSSLASYENNSIQELGQEKRLILESTLLNEVEKALINAIITIVDCIKNCIKDNDKDSLNNFILMLICNIQTLQYYINKQLQQQIC